MFTLVAHIEALNAKTQQWMDENPGAWGGMLTTDPDHWSEMGIYTVAQFNRYMDEETYSEQYKSVYGIRPRHIGDMSDEQLTAAIERMDAEVEEMLEREREMEKRYSLMRAREEQIEKEQDAFARSLASEAERIHNMTHSAPLPWEDEAMRFGG